MPGNYLKRTYFKPVGSYTVVNIVSLKILKLFPLENSIAYTESFESLPIEGKSVIFRIL